MTPLHLGMLTRNIMPITAWVAPVTNPLFWVSPGALLQKAIDLLECGLSPSEVIKGYEMAAEKCLEILETLCCHTVKDVKSAESVVPIIRTSVASKQDGYEDFLADLISDACSKWKLILCMCPIYI